MNDEKLTDSEVIGKLKDLISTPIGVQVASDCQEDVLRNDRESAEFVACASCNERLWVEGKKIVLLKSL
jgi:hypothetical protein